MKCSVRREVIFEVFAWQYEVCHQALLTLKLWGGVKVDCIEYNWSDSQFTVAVHTTHYTHGHKNNHNSCRNYWELIGNYLLPFYWLMAKIISISFNCAEEVFYSEHTLEDKHQSPIQTEQEKWSFKNVCCTV